MRKILNAFIILFLLAGTSWAQAASIEGNDIGQTTPGKGTFTTLNSGPATLGSTTANSLSVLGGATVNSLSAPTLVRQVVQATPVTANLNLTNSTTVNLIAATIYPTTNTSKIIINATGTIDANTAGTSCSFNLVRATGTPATLVTNTGAVYSAAGGGEVAAMGVINYVDTPPASAGIAVGYQIQVNRSSAGGICAYSHGAGGGTNTSTLFLMEAIQ